MVKVFIEVDENALEVLDGFLKDLYTARFYVREDGTNYEDVQYYACMGKKVAKSFGLYPYNQPVVKKPDYWWDFSNPSNPDETPDRIDT